MQTLTERLRLLYRGGLPGNDGPASPPDDNGILGPELPAQQVAFILGLGGEPVRRTLRARLAEAGAAC